jgi:ABC-type polar amino acid transport system ATPase subunit
MLRGLLGQDRTLIVATHDEDFAKVWATRLVRVKGGTVV